MRPASTAELLSARSRQKQSEIARVQIGPTLLNLISVRNRPGSVATLRPASIAELISVRNRVKPAEIACVQIGTAGSLETGAGLPKEALGPCGFEPPGGGSKSQAPDIRCLPFAPPPFDPDLAKLSCNIPCFWPQSKNSYHFGPQSKNSYHFWPQSKNSYHFWAPNRLLATGFANFPRMCFRLPQGCRKGGPKNKGVTEKKKPWRKRIRLPGLPTKAPKMRFPSGRTNWQHLAPTHENWP